MMIDDEHYRQGRVLYNSGVGIRRVFELCEALRATLDKPIDSSTEPSAYPDYRAVESKAKSIAIGYADGFLDDVRKIAGSSRGGGQRA